jgi:hypothetical protein
LPQLIFFISKKRKLKCTIAKIAPDNCYYRQLRKEGAAQYTSNTAPISKVR